MNTLIIHVPVETMTSKEMSALTEIRHDSVKRTIDALAEKVVIALPQIEEVTNHLGQKVTEYRIGKRDNFIIVARLSPEFTARLVGRWQALECRHERTNYSPNVYRNHDKLGAGPVHQQPA